jgi:hypothetical protein
MHLVCCVVGTPNPAVSWYKDGRRLTSALLDMKVSMRFEYITIFAMPSTQIDNGVCTLTKPNTETIDAGEYVCVAENRHGEERSSCAITVTGPVPGPIRPFNTQLQVTHKQRKSRPSSPTRCSTSTRLRALRSSSSVV